MINTNIAWTTTALKMHIQSRHIWIFLQFCWQKIYPEFKLENNKVQKTIPTNNVSQKNSNLYIKKWQTAVVIQFSGTKQYQELQDCFSQKLTLYVFNKKNIMYPNDSNNPLKQTVNVLGSRQHDVLYLLTSFPRHRKKLKN